MLKGCIKNCSIVKLYNKVKIINFVYYLVLTNCSSVDAITGEIWSFMVVHHEISQKMYQMISFSQNGFSSYQLMNDSQMVVKCKRMHMYYFLELEKKIKSWLYWSFFFENIYPIVLWCIRMFQMSCFILLLNRGRTVHLNMKKSAIYQLFMNL